MLPLQANITSPAFPQTLVDSNPPFIFLSRPIRPVLVSSLGALIPNRCCEIFLFDVLCNGRFDRFRIGSVDNVDLLAIHKIMKGRYRSDPLSLHQFGCIWRSISNHLQEHGLGILFTEFVKLGRNNWDLSFIVRKIDELEKRKISTILEDENKIDVAMGKDAPLQGPHLQKIGNHIREREKERETKQRHYRVSQTGNDIRPSFHLPPNNPPSFIPMLLT